MQRGLRFVVAAAVGVATLFLGGANAGAHCDTLNGPVVAAARIALGAGDITPALKWVKPEAEGELRTAFARALAVRKSGGNAQALADTYFFETLVRLHRAGEGAAYTGLKSGESVPPVLQAADSALDGQSIEPLITALTRDVTAGIRERFERAAEAKKHAGDSVDAGRRFVEAYVEYVHYIEGLHGAGKGSTEHRAHTPQHP